MSIDLQAYSNKQIFDRELAAIFSERFYAGSIYNFPQVDCYRSFTLGPKVITVRNTSTGMRAFGNVCLHRSNLIDPLGQGKRRFSCGFHGWSYGSSGNLELAPFTEKSCIKKQELPVYPVGESEGLYFVGTSGEEPCVKKISGALQKLRIKVSSSFYSSSVLHNCNWKLLVENILESYHLTFVHRNTFLPSGFTSSSTHAWESDAYVNIASITPIPSASKLGALRRFAKNADHCYLHAYIFPNLFVSNTNDLIGYIGHIHPVDQKTTTLTWELFELPEMAKLPVAVKEQIRSASIEFAERTLEEDRHMVEACQIGISSDMASVQLQPIEDRVAQFHRYYNERMSHAR